MLKILKNLNKNDIALSIIIICLTFLQTYLDLKLPDYMAEITVLVKSEGSEMAQIYYAGYKMLACAFASLLTFMSIAILASKVASNFSFCIRAKIFEKVMSFSMQDVQSFSTASLITRTTNDITQVQLIIIFGLRMLIKAPITAAWAIMKIADKNSTWTIATAFAVMLLITIVSICLVLVVPKFKKLQKLTDDTNRIARENLDGISVVRAYNAQEYQSHKFEKTNTELTNTHIYTAKVMSFMGPSIQMINNGLILAVYIIGAIIINNASGEAKLILFSDMVVFFSYAIYVIMSFMLLIRVLMQLPRASVSAKRINEILDKKISITEGAHSQALDEKFGEIEFRNVYFKYPDNEDYILKDLNFTIKKNETLAIIGATGCGKSTAVHLIPRFYDVSEGEVLVHGRNVKEYTKNALNSFIAYISQKPILFSGTVQSNVTLGKNSEARPNDTQLISAIEIAQATDFVNAFENTYNETIAQGGKNLSGGQKQRLSIARAIYKDAQILIFDDSFSALDYKTDKNLRHALRDSYQDKTKIIVGQRIATIKDADTILVFEDGKIVGKGKHRDLLHNCIVYKQIALSQLSEEELDYA